jgi:hypothetical protein
VIDPVSYKKRSDRFVVRFDPVFEDVADKGADRTICGFGGHIDRETGLFEVFRKQFDLGTLATTINSFKGNKEIFPHGRKDMVCRGS